MVHRMSKDATIEWFGATLDVIITCNDCGYATHCGSYDQMVIEYIAHVRANERSHSK